MVWKVNRIGIEQVWYSEKLIKAIKELCNDINGLGAKTLAEEIIKLIESEDKNDI